MDLETGVSFRTDVGVFLFVTKSISDCRVHPASHTIDVGVSILEVEGSKPEADN